MIFKNERMIGFLKKLMGSSSKEEQVADGPALKAAQKEVEEAIVAIEASNLSENDKWLVRSYCNKEDFEIVQIVLENNPAEEGLIMDLWHKEAAVFAAIAAQKSSRS